MKFFDRLFRRKKAEPIEEDWDSLVYMRSDVNFDDREQRHRYITNCLEQMAEASKETDLLNGEYALVTSYLIDMEEIEALPETQKEELDRVANTLLVLEQERDRYRQKEHRMKDSDYYTMRRQENEIEEGIEKLTEAEKYAELVKQDLRRIDRERQAYSYRRQELENGCENMRGMAVIFMVALVLCVLMLLVLQYGFEMNTYVGYFISVLAAAIAITVLSVKYMDSSRERDKLVRTINKLIQLQNKVKIRYVNNTNLLDYLYMKYNVDSANKLKKRWEYYQQEKEERKQYAEAEAKAEYYQKELVSILSRYRLHDPTRWINQVAAILDKREMVEIRHELIERRQALRKQLDYNAEVAETAQREIKQVAELYPKYTAEILEMLNAYHYE